MRRNPRACVVAMTVGVLALIGASCGSDDEADDDAGAAVATTEAAEPAEAVTTVASGDSAPPQVDTSEPAAPAFEGELIGTFSVDAAQCDGASVTAGSYFRMLMQGGTLEAGPFIDNADSTCTDTTYTALRPGTDGGLTTGTPQPAPDPAFDATGNGLAAAIFEPVPFFAVAFAGATDPAGTVPTVSAADGKLSGDLSGFTAYYGTLAFNQGGPKPDGSGAGPTGTIDPQTGAYVLEWTSLISGGSFDGFTGVWHLEGTFTPA